MKAGELDREIKFERIDPETINAAGVVNHTWVEITKARARIVQPISGTNDVSRTYGSSTDSILVFQTRWIGGINFDDRVIYAGKAYHIREIKEIGRRRGQEFRIERIGQ